MSDKDAAEGTPVIKVGLKRINLEERIFSDEELKSSPLVRVLGATVIRHVLASSTGKRYADGGRVFLEGDAGDALFYVLKGEARLFTGAGPNEVDFAVVRKGEVMGEREAVGESTRRSCSAQAVGELELVEIPRQVVEQCMEKFPALAQLLRETGKARQRAGAELADFLSRW